MQLSNRPFRILTVSIIISLTACGGDGSSTASDEDNSLSAEQRLGKKLFFDTNLSSDSNQSCASCHDPENGFSDPAVSINSPVSEGSKSGEFGNRNAPTAAYAAFIPDFNSKQTQTPDGTNSNYQGGQFLDGRANDLVEQAKGPFLNPVEMNNGEGIEGKTRVVQKVANASYASEFTAIYGSNALTMANDSDVEQAYSNIATAIASFEKTTELSPFTSKFDYYRAGAVELTESEQRGLELFMNEAKCVNCHTINNPPEDGSDDQSIFSDFNYFNIAVPANPDNPSSEVDIGLAANPQISASDIATERGKFRTPTLRNIELTSPYMHNGVYSTLEEVIRHYDITVADYIDPEIDSLFFVPEVEENIANELKTRLNLQQQDYIDLENFMLTLTDGYTI